MRSIVSNPAECKPIFCDAGPLLCRRRRRGKLNESATATRGDGLALTLLVLLAWTIRQLRWLACAVMMNDGPEFTPDGRYLYVGNYLDKDISILKVDGTNVTDTGKRFKLPGHPASGRMSMH